MALRAEVGTRAAAKPKPAAMKAMRAMKSMKKMKNIDIASSGPDLRNWMVQVGYYVKMGKEWWDAGSCKL